MSPISRAPQRTAEAVRARFCDVGMTLTEDVARVAQTCQLDIAGRADEGEGVGTRWVVLVEVRVPVSTGGHPGAAGATSRKMLTRTVIFAPARAGGDAHGHAAFLARAAENLRERPVEQDGVESLLMATTNAGLAAVWDKMRCELNLPSTREGKARAAKRAPGMGSDAPAAGEASAKRSCTESLAVPAAAAAAAAAAGAAATGAEEEMTAGEAHDEGPGGTTPRTTAAAATGNGGSCLPLSLYLHIALCFSGS